MKSFQNLQEIFRMQFINLSLDNQISSLSWKNALVLLIQAQLLVQSLAFLIFKADTNFERGLSYYIFATVLVAINIYLIFIKKKYDISVFLDKFDKFIEESEQNSSDHI